MNELRIYNLEDEIVLWIKGDEFRFDVEDNLLQTWLDGDQIAELFCEEGYYAELNGKRKELTDLPHAYESTEEIEDDEEEDE